MKKSLIILSLLLVLIMASCKCKHEWGEWEKVSEKTCETDYIESRTCKKCGISDTKVIESKGHNYSDVYFKRYNGHYQKCQDCGKITEIEQHIKSEPSSTGSIVCTKCNYLIEVGVLGFYQNLAYSLDNQFMVKIDNLIIKANSQLDGEMEISLNDIKCYVEIIDGEFIGYLSGNIKISELKNQFAVNTIYVNGNVIINEKNVYVIGNVETPNLVEDYFGGKYYMVADLEELIYDEMTIMPETLISIYQSASEISNMIDLFNEEDLKKFFETFFIISKNDNQFELDFSYDYIKEFIDNAFNKNIKNLFNHYFGKYAFGDLLIDIELLLDTKIGLLISKLESSLNITLEELLNELDDFAKKITNDEDITFEEVIGIGIDLEELLTSEEFTSKTIIQLIAEEENVTEKEMMDEIISGLEEIGNSYLYQLLGYTDAHKELLKSEIDKAMELIEKGFSLKLTTDEEGKLEKINFSINLNVEDVYQNVNINGEMIFDSNIEEIEYNNSISEINNFFNNIDYGKFFVTDEDQSISFEKDANGNVTTVIISNKTYANSYSSDYVLLSTDVRKNTYYYDLSLVEKSKIAYLSCDNWAYITLPGEFKLERSNYTITYHYNENGELIDTTESKPIITESTTMNFDFAYNMVTNELNYDNYHMNHMHQFELKEVIEPNTNNCDEMITYVYECSNCFKQVKEYELIGHSKVYRNEIEFLDGEDCSNGVIVKSYCKNCNELIRETNNTHHEKYLVEYYSYEVKECRYDEKEHGVQFFECACGKYKELNCINIHFSEYRVDENNKGYNAYYCHGCDFVVRVYTVSEENEEDCSTTYYNTYKLYNKDVFLTQFEKTNVVYNHDLTHKSRLQEGSVSCTDGVENYWECKNCGYIEMDDVSYRHENSYIRYSLSEYGCKCENGYYEKKVCPCGEKDYGINDIYLDSEQYMGYSYNTSTSTRRTKYICEECNFRYVIVETSGQKYYEVNCDENFENGIIIK